METVRKDIPIWRYRNRDESDAWFYRYGSVSDEYVIPGPEESNYGGFCCDVEISGETYVYLQAYEAYISLRKQLDYAIFLSKITKSNMPDCSTGGSYPLKPKWYRKVDNFIAYSEGIKPYESLSGLVYVRKDELVPDVLNTYTYTGNETANTLVAIDEVPEYLDIFFRMANGSLYQETGATPMPPMLSIPVLLTEDYTKNGMVRVIQYNLDENGRLVPTTDLNNYFLDGTSNDGSEECRIESKLERLKVEDTVIDEKTNEHRNYIFTGESSYVKITFEGYDSGDTAMTYNVIYPADSGKDGDIDTYWTTASTTMTQTNFVISSTIDVLVNNSSQYMVSSTIESAIGRMKEAEIQPGRYCIFQILYSGTDFPYDTKAQFNKIEKDDETYYADFVSEIIEEESSVTITYVLGGTFTKETDSYSYEQGTGIIYTESYPCHDDVDYISIDGASHVPVYYKRIDYSEATVIVDNPWLELSREAVVGNQVAYKKNQVWGGHEPTFKPVASDDKYADMIFTPTVTADVVFNRGNATAFERHFKLSECNTVQDVEQYGNNAYFNI